jgi:adenine-specific DNA-methyltransferase
MSNKQKLELTWIGKENRPKLEPRILLEDPEYSHHAAQRVGENDIFDNRLIKGDNLLALKALEQEYSGKVKCVYIDPPFNTGAAFEHYDDGVEHSLWLSLMSERLKLMHSLISKDGSIFVHLDDNESDYCRIILDEIFGRKNFIARITIDARSPSAFSTVNTGVFKSSEYVLWFAKDKSYFFENGGRVEREVDYAYNLWLSNPDEECSKWKFTSVLEAYANARRPRSTHPKSILKHFNDFIVENAHQVCRLASISDTGAGQAIVELKYKSSQTPNRVLCLRREQGLDDVFVMDGQQVIFYSKNVSILDNKRVATKLLTNIWTDIAWEGIAGEGGVQFKKGKKPERLIKRVLELATNPGDIVLDSFAGSGTTGAVAHKMGRRWIMVELGDHCETHIVPRLQKVIDGEDSGGITKAVNWKGGGGFRYYKLAPSLLERDRWGNWVINKSYNAAMLAEAMCKHEGFTYAPSDTTYWQQGQSSETDYIYTTTQTLTHEQLAALSHEVGEGRTLLICCSAFRANLDAFPNLTVKKIPRVVMNRCEFGRDDYSLQVQNLPPAPPDEGDADGSTPRRAPAGKRAKAPTNSAPSLFEESADQ